MDRINALTQSQIEARKAHAVMLDAHLAAAAAGNVGFTAEQKAEQAAAETKITSLAEMIAAEQRRLDLATPLAAAPPSITVGKPNAAGQPWHTAADGPTKPEGVYNLSQAEHVGLGRWAMAVMRAMRGEGADPRLIKAASLGMNEASGELGGFAVPVEYAPGIEKTMFTVGEILSRVDARTITGNAISYTVIDEKSRVDGSRQGGILGYWLDEGELKIPSTFKLRRLEMKLRKVAALGYMSDELLEDAAALGQELEIAFAHELIFQVENKIWRGSGAGVPLGFTVSPVFVSVPKETSQVALTVNTFNLSKMWARLPAASQKNAAWFINVDVQPQLDILSIPVVVGSAGGPLEPRFVNYNQQGVLTIKGRPVIPVEYAETLGTLGDIVLADMKQYRLIRKASGIQQASSIHVEFKTDQTAFRAVYRVDGQPVQNSPITPFKGTAPLSPFVGLATRA